MYPPGFLCLLIFFPDVIFNGYVVVYCMDGTMLHFMNLPMLTSGSFPSSFTVINNTEMNITRVVFRDMLDRMSSDSQQECGGGPGSATAVRGKAPCPDSSSGPLGCTCVYNFAANFIQLPPQDPSWDPDAAA